MQNEQSQIKSIRQALAGGFVKPDPLVNDRYIQELAVVEKALTYLKEVRGLTDETIAYFKLGYCSERDSISIPVYKGKELVNIRYRSLNPDAQSRYTQERGCEVWLYHDQGIELAKHKRGILITEGEFDLMSAWQAGFKNVVSPASGKDSYGPWIEMLDAIPKVYIAYDNDKPGKAASLEMAERVGIDKCYEVLYPEGFKDANDFFLKHNTQDFVKLLKEAQPYYKHKFAGVGDIIDALNEKEEPRLVLDTVPFIRWTPDWLTMLSADSGGGKTTYALNVVDELVNKGIPTLVFPFERGINTVGERYLQVRYNKQSEDLETITEEEKQAMRIDSVNLPLYFSKPTPEQFFDTIIRAKRLFGIKFIVVDHVDYFVHGDDKFSKQADFVRDLKEFLIENEIMCIAIHHIGKDKEARRRGRKLAKEDMKGASELYQIPEAVVLLYPGDEGQVIINVDKNKGPEGCRQCKVDMSTGRFSKFTEISNDEMARIAREAEEAWNN